MRISRTVMIAGVLPALLAAQAGPADGPTSRLERTTELSSAPRGERIAVLMAGAPVRVLESSSGWSRVEVEGWIPAEESPTGEPASPAPEAGTTEATTPALGASLAGSIFVTSAGGKTFAGARIAVRLLQDGAASQQEMEKIRTGCASRHKSLEMQADMLKQQAERALKTVESTSSAFEAYDEAKRQRTRKLREMQAADEECLSRIESVVDGRAAARTLSNGDGRYIFDRVQPGVYLVQASLEADDLRHEWELEIELTPSRRVDLDLTNANRARVEQVPSYR